MTDRDLLVLVVDDDPTIREALVLRSRDWGYEACAAADLAEAEELLAERDPDLVVADVVLPDASELELLGTVQADDAGRPVILITAHGSIDLAVEAMKNGAYDFLTKPLDADKLEALLASAAEEVEQRERIRALEDRIEAASLGPMVGESRSMSEVFRAVKLLAENEASALVTGESGTGKELVARTIHRLSDRAGADFVAVNTAAIPEGLIESELFGHEEGAFTGATRSRAGCFEMADGGTLLLDEIAEMPADLQPKLLRIIEEGSVRRVGASESVSFDVRVLAATNQDPEKAVEEGRLREDLLYRLNVFEVRIPPLRERPEDVALLAHHFVRTFDEKHGLEVEGIDDQALERLEAYDWPGNVRELRNVVERSVIVAGSGFVAPDHLPAYVREPDVEVGPELVLPLDITAREAEKRLILRTLDRVDGNKAEAARRLDLDPKTIRNKLKRYRESDGDGDGDTG
jgi:DNA-binding NtrC family response regulator